MLYAFDGAVQQKLLSNFLLKTQNHVTNYLTNNNYVVVYGARHYNTSNTAQNVSNLQKNFEFFFITLITKLMSNFF